MATDDCWGRTYITKTGEVFEDKCTGSYCIEYYYAANDGIRYLRRGNETEIRIKIDTKVRIPELKGILQKAENINSLVRDILTGMVKAGKVEYFVSQPVK